MEAVDGLHESAVIAVAEAPDRGLDAGLGQALGVADRQVSGVAVARVDEITLNGSALVQRMLQGVEHEAGVGRAGDPPPDNAPGIGVNHESDVGEA